jgi:hypothetical protein
VCAGLLAKIVAHTLTPYALHAHSIQHGKDASGELSTFLRRIIVPNDSASVGSIFDVIKKGFEAAEVAVKDIRSVVESLNGVRSVVVTVGNNTSKDFQLLRTHHDHGNFAAPHNPVGLLKSRESIVFGSQNTADSIATGTEGSVTYMAERCDATLGWVNPFVGENEVRANLQGAKRNAFRVVATSGAGNQKAPMRFDIFEIETKGFDVFGAILDKWAEVGWSRSPLGFPTSHELPAFDGIGRFRNFEGGLITWHPETGAHIVWGGLGERWLQIGREQFGYPLTDELPTRDPRGKFYHLRAVHLPGKPEASIFWTPETGAHEIVGAIRARWAALDWDQSPLKFPINHEVPTFDGIGRTQQFEGGMISFHPDTGAHAVFGAIGERWIQIGRENFGYPTTDETVTRDRRGRFNHFRTVQVPEKPEASIYWTPQTGAHAVFGGIRAKWMELNAEMGRLGYPVSAERGHQGGRIQQFERGSLFWTPQAGVVVQ